MTERRLQAHLILRDSGPEAQASGDAQTFHARMSIAAGHYDFQMHFVENDWIIDIFDREPEAVG